MIEKRNIDVVLKRILEDEKNSREYREFVDKASNFRKNLAVIEQRFQRKILSKDILFSCGTISGVFSKTVEEAVIFTDSVFGYLSDNYRKNAAVIKYSDISEIRLEENLLTIFTNFEERVKVVSPYAKFYERILKEAVALNSQVYSQKLEAEERNRPSSEEDFIVAAAPEVKRDLVVDPEINYEVIASKKAEAGEMIRAMMLHNVILVITTRDVSLSPNSDIQTKLLRLDGYMRAYDDTKIKNAVLGTPYEPLINICEEADSVILAYLRHEEDLVDFVRFLNDRCVGVYKKLMVRGKKRFLGEFIRNEEEQRVFNMLNAWKISTTDTYTVTLLKNLFAKTSENEDEYEYHSMDMVTGEFINKTLPDTILVDEYYYDALKTAEDFMALGFEVEIKNQSGKSMFDLNENLCTVVTSGSIGDEPEVYRQFICQKLAPGKSPEFLEVKLHHLGSNRNAVVNYMTRAFGLGILEVNTWIDEGKEPLVLKLDQTLAIDSFIKDFDGSILINDGEYNANDLLNPKPETNKFIRITR